MCLRIAIARPDDVLARGKHAGFEWIVTNNGMGFRCGYVKVAPGHPWHGKGYDDIDADAHGGLTFAEADMSCGKDGPDDGWWFGFDAGHAGDMPDLSLSCDQSGYNIRRMLIGLASMSGGEVRSQEYMESECRKLCEQARSAVNA